MIWCCGICLACSAYFFYSTYKFTSQATAVTATVIKTDIMESLAVNIPTSVDIGNPNPGALKTQTRYKTLVKYIDPRTNTENSIVLPADREYRPNEVIEVLISNEPNKVVLNSLWSVWGVAVCFFIGAGFCAALLEFFKEHEAV